MIWRLGSFLAGLPGGALAVWAWRAAPEAGQLGLGMLLGGSTLLAIVSLAARRAEAGAAPRLAAATQAGWLGGPALGAVWLGLAPGAGVWLGIVAFGLVASGVASARGPRAGATRVALVSLLGGAVLAVLLGGVCAGVGSGPLTPSESRVHYVYDLDAGVAIAPRPRCAPRAARARVLLGRGAHPRLAADGRALWFDAEGPSGRRQVHRLSRGDGAVVCWTCGEPGRNRRPAPGPAGHSVVFDSDRHAGWLRPLDTEVYMASARGDAPPRASQRLTFSRGPDDHALLDPGGRIVVWSRGGEGRYAVVTAPLRRGHGGTLLGPPSVLVPGGTAWIAPSAWSRDARALAVVRGQPSGLLSGAAYDFASGEQWSLGRGLLPAASVAFSADGQWQALVEGGRGVGFAGRVPAALGFLAARLAAAFGPDPARFEAASVGLGPTRAEPARVEIGEVAAWGNPAGIALEPDGTGFVLAQWRRRAEGAEERLVEIQLACDAAADEE